jgi:hypothetical protein
MLANISATLSWAWGQLINIYLPAYFQWLTEKLSKADPFTTLSFVIMVVFALIAYSWFRNREI